MGNIIKLLTILGTYLLVLVLSYSKRVNKCVVRLYLGLQSEMKEKMEVVKKWLTIRE